MFIFFFLTCEAWALTSPGEESLSKKSFVRYKHTLEDSCEPRTSQSDKEIRFINIQSWQTDDGEDDYKIETTRKTQREVAG